MKKTSDIVISGLGITSAIGQGKEAFLKALLEGKSSFRIMKRQGRQKESAFIGAEIDDLSISEHLRATIKRTSLSAQVALVTLAEAWEEAKLSDADSQKVGLIIGGSNVGQRELLLNYQKYEADPYFIRPQYGMTFMDTDLCGLCTEQFGIHGMAYTVGGASASGQLAILQAVQAIRNGQVESCIALGALMDLSYMECHAFRSMGAMGSALFAEQPNQACRPFNQRRDGFIYGESCGAVVVELLDTALKRKATPRAIVSGWSMVIDGHRNPDPSLEGECRVIKQSLAQAKLSPENIDYINPHGSGSKIGDETELKAIKECGLSHACINVTKSITGHGLTAAGAVEVVATVLQMNTSQLHPSLNLEEPIDLSLNWIKKPISHVMNNALTLSFGFGGVNTALCLTSIK
jgi:malonyl-ACP decarboxylase